MHSSGAAPSFWERRPLTCPNCRSDLRFEVLRMKHPLQCPICREPIDYSFLHGLLMAVGGLVFSFVAVGILADWGLKGFILVLLLLVFLFPGSVLAHGLLLFLMPPTFVRRQPTITTLFHSNMQ